MPWAVGGPAAVSSALTHSPWTVGGPALCAGINFPGVSNLTSAYLFDTLVTGMGQSDELKFKDVTTKILLGECM